MRSRFFAVSGAAVLALAATASAEVTVTTTISTKCESNSADTVRGLKETPSIAAAREELDGRRFKRAVALLSPMAEAGNAEAQRMLGALLVRQGCNIPTDKEAGAEWLRKAAEGKDVPAAFLYARALLNGTGVKQDDVAAVEWTRRAAIAGYPEAQVQLGYFYFTGRGVEKNAHEAIGWTVRAGEQGAPMALSNIAKSYMSGNSLPKDLHRAMYFIAAAAQRIPPGQPQMTSRINQTRYAIARQLSVDDVHSIEKDAEKWSPGKGSLSGVLKDSDNFKPTSDAAGDPPQVAE